jgi:hypothetical protein
MKQLPSGNQLKQRFVLFILILTFGPAVTLKAGQMADPLLTFLVPWLMVGLVVAALYALLVRRYRR